MASGHSVTKKATIGVQAGTNWGSSSKTDHENLTPTFDDNLNTYIQKTGNGNSACHINGFGIDLPSNATVEKVEVYFRVYTSNSYGYFAGYLYSNASKTIAYQIFINGAKASAQYYKLTVTADTIKSKLDSLGIYDGNILTYLRDGLRIRWVGGAKSSYNSSTCNVYDNYVTVYYALPDYSLNITAGTGGKISGTANGTYEAGTSISVTAVPDDGYEFDHWDGWSGTSPTISGSMLDNITATAVFRKTNGILQIQKVTGGSVSAEAVTGSCDRITYLDGYDCWTISPVDSIVKLTPIPDSGYKFTGWSDGNTDNPRQVTVGEGYTTLTPIFSKKISITFKTNPYTEPITDAVLGYNTDGSTEYYAVKSYTEAIEFDSSTDIYILFSGSDKYKFIKWIDQDGNEYTDYQFSITVNKEITITAVLEMKIPPEFTSVELLYNSAQISSSNKVPAGEGFIVAVGVK